MAVFEFEISSLLQGVPFEKSQKEMAVALKRYIFDPMLVKPKLVWEAVVFCAKNWIFEKSKKI